MEVKVFENSTGGKLEKEINEFYVKNPNIIIISVNQSESADDGLFNTTYSVTYRNE